MHFPEVPLYIYTLSGEKGALAFSQLASPTWRGVQQAARGSCAGGFLPHLALELKVDFSNETPITTVFFQSSLG